MSATVRLRQKPLRDGRRTIYLDYYDHGRRWLEYLKLYLTGKRSDTERDKQTWSSPKT